MKHDRKATCRHCGESIIWWGTGKDLGVSDDAYPLGVWDGVKGMNKGNMYCYGDFTGHHEPSESYQVEQILRKYEIH